MNKGKRYAELAKLVDRSVLYDPTDAAKLVCETGKAKFDETVELHVRLGVDSRTMEEMEEFIKAVKEEITNAENS